MNKSRSQLKLGKCQKGFTKGTSHGNEAVPGLRGIGAERWEAFRENSYTFSPSLWGHMVSLTISVNCVFYCVYLQMASFTCLLVIPWLKFHSQNSILLEYITPCDCSPLALFTFPRESRVSD